MDANTNKILFPQCGITYADCVGVAGLNQRAAAKRLGISLRNFGEVIRKNGMTHLYPHTRASSRCVSKDDVIQVASEGYTRKDAAYILGISYGYLRDLVKDWDLGGYFISTGEAISVARNGYCSHNLAQSMR